MNITRKYILPNCTLVLEGLPDAAETESDDFAPKPLSILMNAEFHFIGSNQKLTGGSDFFKNVVNAVSDYAQEFLSGLPHLSNSQAEFPQVHITNIEEKNLHRLICEPEPNTGQQKSEIDLTTVEFFDLVEAVDQFFVDNQTLRDMTLELQAVSRKHRQPDEPLLQRVTPVFIGIASLAFATATFFVLPIPEVPELEPTPDSNSTEVLPTPLEEREPEN